MRWLPLAVLFLTSCLAPKVSDDAGVGEGGTSAECVAAGGTCLGPGPACLSVISVNISCVVNGTVCCTPATAATIAAAAAASGDATTAPAPADAGGAASTSTCDTSCEATCEGDPICVQNCGC
jgi:hypothetical protein